jgi:ssDNA-binding replication factor A large subunit
MLQKAGRLAMQAVLEKDFSPRGSSRNVVVRVLQIWENKDQAKNVDELGFIVVDQLVPSEH